jgi:class 3 adenylate cyclase
MLCPSCGHENREGARFCLGCGASLALSCPGCGKELPSGARFCDSCGQAIGEPTAPPPTPTPAPAPTVPTSFASGRYQVKRFLGEGGRKRVYLAHDTRLDRDVAFSLIKTEGLDASGLARVRREAQAMGRLGSHPHIVTVHDIGDENRQPYIIQEFMEGGSVLDIVDQAPDHRLPIDQCLLIASEVCQALQHAHDRGIIHRDVKPGNIWLTADPSAGSGQAIARLGDFGLAVAIDLSRLTQAGMMVGTVAYMPPEQALGGKVDARSDLYGLGGTLYEMLTGRPPFLGDDAVAIISQHINVPPVAPSWHNKDIPKPLENLVLRLLAKAPEERPESAQAVLDELQRIVSLPAEAKPESAVEPSPLAQVETGRMVGRQTELATLKSALDDAFSANGRMVMVSGEPGMGKTRLLEELAVYARLRGAQVLTGRCEEEGTLPYLPFVEALRSYIQDKPAEALRSELGDAAPDVARLVSEIRLKFPDIPEPVSVDPEEERFRLFQGVTSFLRSAASSSPILLVLDSLQWADRSSLLLLRHLSRRLEGTRIVIAATYREEELDTRHPLAEVLAEMSKERAVQRLALRGLSRQEVEEQLAALAGAHPDRAVVDAVYRETAGNPFFVAEVFRHLTEEGKVIRQDGRWRTESDVLELGIPQSLKVVVGKRLEALCDDCQKMLTLASVIGRQFPFRLLLALSEVEEEKLLDHIDEALAHHVIQEEPSGQAYRFASALYRQALHEGLSGPRRARLHRRVAEAMEELYSSHIEEVAPELAHHFSQIPTAEVAEKTVRYCLMAAERATRSRADAEAVRFLQSALEAMEDAEGDVGVDKARVLRRLGRTARAAGEERLAEDTFHRCLSLQTERGDAAGVAQVRSLLVDMAWPRWEYDTAAEHCRAGLAALGDLEIPLRYRLEFSLGHSLTQAARYEEAEPIIRSASEALERLGDRRNYAVALSGLSWTVGMLGRLTEARELGHRAAEVGQQCGDPLSQAYGLWNEFWAALQEGGELARAEELLAGAVDTARQARHPHLRICLSWRGMLFLLQGRWQDALRQAEEVTSSLPDTDAGRDMGGPAARMVEAYALEETGDLEQAQAAVESELATRKEPLFQPFLGLALARLASLKGDRAASEGHLAGVEQQLIAYHRGQKDALLRRWYLVGYAAEARISAGIMQQPQRYYQAISSVPRVVEALSGLNPLCLTDRVLGMLAACMGDWQKAEAHFADAQGHGERLGARPELGRTYYWWADMHQRRGQPGDPQKAMQLLDKALAIFQDLGMKVWVEKALARKLDLQVSTESPPVAKTSLDLMLPLTSRDQQQALTQASPEGTVTILFTDIEGSTALAQRLGDKAYHALLAEHNRILREQVARHGGHEVKCMGDGFMVAFASAARALSCAVDIQKAFAAYNREHAEEAIAVRIGLNTGESIEEAGDYFGTAVTLAARIAARAQGGQILVSEVVRTVGGSLAGVEFRDAGRKQLKGIKGRQRVYEVVW